MTIEPRELTEGRRADIEFGIRKGIYGGNFAACYAALLHVEGELTAAQDEIKTLGAALCRIDCDWCRERRLVASPALALRLAKVLRENERLRDKLDAIAEADDTGIVTVDDLKRWASEALEAQP